MGHEAQTVNSVEGHKADSEQACAARAILVNGNSARIHRLGFDAQAKRQKLHKGNFNLVRIDNSERGV